MKEVRYLVTGRADTREITRVQRVEAGDALVDVPLEDVLKDAAAMLPGSGSPVVLNLFGGSSEAPRDERYLRALQVPEYKNTRA